MIRKSSRFQGIEKRNNGLDRFVPMFQQTSPKVRCTNRGQQNIYAITISHRCGYFRILFLTPVQSITNCRQFRIIGKIEIEKNFNGNCYVLCCRSYDRVCMCIFICVRAENDCQCEFQLLDFCIKERRINDLITSKPFGFQV